MRIKAASGVLFVLAIFGMGIAPAFAHAHVKSMSIAENAQLQEAPASFNVKFSEKVGLVKVTLTRSTSEIVPLGYLPPKEMAASFQIPLPTLTTGAYTLSWRTMGDDGHAMNGVVRFSIVGK